MSLGAETRLRGRKHAQEAKKKAAPGGMHKGGASALGSEVKGGVERVIVRAGRGLGDAAQRLAEALVVHDLPLAQEAQGSEHVGVVRQADQVLIGGARLLLRGHVLAQVRDRIALGLELTGVKRNPSRRLWPDPYSMIHIIIRKSLFLNLLYRQIAGKLMNNCTNHLNMI